MAKDSVLPGREPEERRPDELNTQAANEAGAQSLSEADTQLPGEAEPLNDTELPDETAPPDGAEPPDETEPLNETEPSDEAEPQEGAPGGRRAGKPAGKKLSRLALNAVMLLIKLLIAALIAFMLLSYVFGLTRNLSLNMQPAVQDGDLIFFYRLVNDYAADDVVVLHYHGKSILSRVVAVAGDTVDITDKGLVINGNEVFESNVIGSTTQFEGGVTFPLKVPKGQAFVLGDNRSHATDSRIFGCIKVSDIDGRVIGLFRRRNF